MKKLLFILFLITTIGCGVEKKVAIVGKCPRCEKIISAETTFVYGKYTKNSKGQFVFTNNKDKRDAVIVDKENNNIITHYNYELCEDCEKVKADSFFVLGKNEYRSRNYYTAIGHFREAKKLGNEEVSHWIKKAKKKEAEAERREQRKRERERIAEEKRKYARKQKRRSEEREAYGERMQESASAAWPGIEIIVNGPGNRYYTLYYKGIWMDLMTDNFVAFLDKGTFWQDKRNRGFTRVYFKSIYGYSKCVYLK
ncbi:hypothetical protein ES703_66872 [subsurface metagenome]